MTLGGFFVFLQCHHVYRAHVVELRSHLAIEFLFLRESFAFDHCDGGVSEQNVACKRQLLEAGLSQMLHVRLKSGERCRELAAPIAERIEFLARSAQGSVELGGKQTRLIACSLQFGGFQLAALALCLK